MTMDYTAELIPPIGHGQANIYPDEPYLKWKYTNSNSKKCFEIDNTKRTMDAAYHIYNFLTKDVRNEKSQIFETESYPWDQVERKIESVLCSNNPIDIRIVQWHDSLKNGFFGFKSNVEYDDREWFKQAVVVIDKNRGIYDKNENFHKSDWKYFHDALTIHKFYIKNELLSDYGIIT